MYTRLSRRVCVRACCQPEKVYRREVFGEFYYPRLVMREPRAATSLLSYMTW
jgi:hypothetical protein